MSSIPGYTLEDYLAWELNITVENQKDSNWGVGLAETLGNVRPRPHLPKEEFAKIVSIFESDRETVEGLLQDYDEETQSWRTYSEVVCDAIGENLLRAGESLAKAIAARVDRDRRLGLQG